MKISTYFLAKTILFLALLPVHSQTLTCQYNCPQIGQLFSISTGSPVSGSGGINKVWNFTQIPISTALITVAYVDPATTPAANSFPQATVAKLQSGQYTYIETGSGQVKASVPPTTTVNVQPVGLPLPFHYGSSFTETIISQYYSGSNKIEVLKSKILNGIGTGTLILKSGTYNDVLLISGQTVQTRTIAGVPEGNVITNSFSYYYSEKIPHPLVYSEQKSETGPVDYAPYTEFMAGLYTDISNESVEKSNFIELTPHPVSDVVKITSSNNELGEISLINVLGETVLNLPYSGGFIELDLKEFPIGFYTLIVLQLGDAQSKKLIVSR